MTNPTDVQAATAATPFKGCFATYGLHKDYIKPEEREDALKVLLEQVAAFKAKYPDAAWAAEATFEFTWTATGKGDDGSDLQVFRLEWEGVNNRFAPNTTPVDVSIDNEQDELESDGSEPVGVAEGT